MMHAPSGCGLDCGALALWLAVPSMCGCCSVAAWGLQQLSCSLGAIGLLDGWQGAGAVLCSERAHLAKGESSACFTDRWRRDASTPPSANLCALANANVHQRRPSDSIRETLHPHLTCRSLSLLRNKVKVYELKNRSCLSLVVPTPNFL